MNTTNENQDQDPSIPKRLKVLKTNFLRAHKIMVDLEKVKSAFGNKDDWSVGEREIWYLAMERLHSFLDLFEPSLGTVE